MLYSDLARPDLGGKKEGEKMPIPLEIPIEINNLDDLVEFLEDQQEKPEENSFLDLHEPEILDDFTYRRMQRETKKYGYAVRNV